MNERLVKLIEEIFFAKLQAKTGWGRNDVMVAYKESVAEAALKMLDSE